MLRGYVNCKIIRGHTFLYVFYTFYIPFIYLLYTFFIPFIYLILFFSSREPKILLEYLNFFVMLFDLLKIHKNITKESCKILIIFFSSFKKKF